MKLAVPDGISRRFSPDDGLRKAAGRRRSRFCRTTGCGKRPAAERRKIQRKEEKIVYSEDFEATAKSGLAKVTFLKTNPAGYFVSSMLAGIYIGFGSLLMNSIAGQLEGNPAAKMISGAAFSVALSLVVMAGAELFTGNNMAMAAGVFKKKITLADAVKLLAVCWLGNLAGSWCLVILFHFSGLQTGNTAEALAQGAAAKMSIPFGSLLIRGLLCNMLVCLAIWCSTRAKSDAGKLIMVFWCILAFVTTGFEHSIANMTQLSAALLDPAGEAVSFGGYVYNLLTVTLGNMIGGILFVAVPYYICQKND
jgi:nitrite transporter NirC